MTRRSSPEYRIWAAMKARCQNQSHASFKDYGGRGISVCERWTMSFEAFLEDMGPRPVGLFIERKDNNGNYEPGNCRWATRLEQANNKSNNRIVDWNGRSISLSDFIRESGTRLPYNTVLSRLKLGYSPDEALSSPRYQKLNCRKRNPIYEEAAE